MEGDDKNNNGDSKPSLTREAYNTIMFDIWKKRIEEKHIVDSGSAIGDQHHEPDALIR